MARSTNSQRERLQQRISEVEREYGDRVQKLLADWNRTRLDNRAQIHKDTLIDEHSLRWVMKWKEAGKVSFELSIVVRVEDNGREARVGGVWVRRHAATPLDFDGHRPTTRMRRVARLNINDIREAIEAERG